MYRSGFFFTRNATPPAPQISTRPSDTTWKDGVKNLFQTGLHLLERRIIVVAFLASYWHKVEPFFPRSDQELELHGRGIIIV